MNKLVSRNPVLRFKLGRKIVKAQFGNIVLIDSENDIWQDKSTGKKYLRNWRGRRWNRTPQGTSSNDFGNYFLEYSPSVPQLRIGMNGEPIIDTVSKLNTINNSTNINVAKEKTHNWLEGLRNKYVRPFLKTAVIPQQLTQIRKTTLKKDSITPSVFAGYKIGKTGGLNYSINDADKQQLIGTGQFTESDFTNALATLLALNRYFANSGLGSVKEDNYWGDLSRAALALALSKSKSLTPFNNETTVVKTPITPTYTPPTTPINLEITNLKLNVPTYVAADRSQTRDWMRSNGINPYSVTGAMRAAARRIRAGQANDNDRLLLKGNEQLYNLLKGYYKQGGRLPSRNIVERFKYRKGGLINFIKEALPPR